MARKTERPSRGRRWHGNGLQDGGDGGTCGALSLGAALGLMLAREGAVPSRGRRWHGNGLQDGGDGGTGGALSLGAALGLLLELEGAVPSRGRRRHWSRLWDGGRQGGGIGGASHARTHTSTPHTRNWLLLAPLVQLAA
jgi:hypothetical protein